VSKEPECAVLPLWPFSFTDVFAEVDIAEETETLRQLHTRINEELAEQFPDTQAPFDGLSYHFHLTVALGGASSLRYQSIITELESQNIAFQAIARHLVMCYYDDDQISPGSFLTYKILPLGKTHMG
jgi:2'-5' RNA ligase